jgi:glucokinase
VLSGPGLRRLYDFLVHESLTPATALAEIQRAEDPNAEIGRLGSRDLDRGCAAAVAFFADMLGAELGNVALETLPRGGLYLVGAVARNLRSALEQGDLLDSFLDKNAMEDLLRTIPLALIDEPDLPLNGALRAASALLG